MIVATTLSVLGLIRETVPSSLLATQTEPVPNAIPAGERPTGIVAVTERLPGSIRATTPSVESTTQTAPAPTVIEPGPLPTGIVVSRPVGSTRITLPASVSLSQIAPPPTATPAGLAFGSSCCSTLPVPASNRVTRPVEGATQTASP